MDHFAYRSSRDPGNGAEDAAELVCEWVPASEIVRKFATPVVVYSSSTLVDRFYAFAEAFAPLRAMVAFPVSSTGSTAVLRTLLERGAGVYVSSGGELERAWAAGSQFSRVIFGGVAKRPEEIRAALDGLYSPLYTAGVVVEGKPPYYRGPVGWMVAETPSDLSEIAAIASAQRIVCRVLLRVGAPGRVEGFTREELSRAALRFAGDRCVKVIGLACGVPDPGHATERIAEAVSLAQGLREAGATVDTLSFDDGFAGAVDWVPEEPAVVAGVIRQLRDEVEERGTKIVLSPGAALASRAGVLLTTVLEVIEREGTRYAVCDAGVHAAPPLAGVDRFVWPVEVPATHAPGYGVPVQHMSGLERVTLAGPSGRPGDVLAADRALPRVERGTVLAVFQCGSETMSRATTRADRPLPAEVMVAHSVARLLRERRSLADALHAEIGADDRDR